MTVYISCVRVKVNYRKLAYLTNKSPGECIWRFHLYDVEYEIENQHSGFIFTKYDLKLRGEKQDIELYLGYLKRRGFEITELPSRVTFF